MRLWDGKYPHHRWDSTTRAIRRTRQVVGRGTGKTATLWTTDTIIEEELLASGILFLEGDHWKELPFTATHKAGSNLVEAEDATVQLSLHLKRGDKVRLLAPDGTIEAEGAVQSRARKDPDDHVLRSGQMPHNGATADRAGLRVLVLDPQAVPAAGISTPTTEHKLLFDGLASFDVTSVYQFVAMDKGHKLLEHAHPGNDGLRQLFKDVKNGRNDSWGHATGAVVGEAAYRDACAAMKRWADECVGVKLLNPEDAVQMASVIEQLDGQQYFAEGHTISLLTGVQGALAKADRQIITLTKLQTATYGRTWDAMLRRSARMLVQAPSGSGKTVICVKLAAQFLIDECVKYESDRRLDSWHDLQANVRLETTPVPGVPSLLLLTSSPVLAKLTANNLCADLAAACPGSRPTAQSIGNGVYDISLDAYASGAIVRAASIDGFIGSRADETTVEYSGPKFSAVVVDEGHVVFSFQADNQLHGQHQFEDASKVRDFLEQALNSKDTPIVVFHDENYQLVGSSGAQANLSYPLRCERVSAKLAIIRNPGPVRDASVPFAKKLDYSTRALGRPTGSKNGRLNFYPLFDESAAVGSSVHFIDVPRENVKVGSPMSTRLSDLQLSGEHRNIMSWKCADQSWKYAVQIVAELERLRKLFDIGSDSGSTDWARHVAILVPGSPSVVATELLSAVTDATTEGGRLLTPLGNLPELSAALPKTPGYGPTDLYFGPVENFAGLERPLVIVTGMQHPLYKEERPPLSDDVIEFRVSPRMYLAVTRCTFELSVIEVAVEFFASHFKISAAATAAANHAPASNIEYYGSAWAVAYPKNAILEPDSSDGGLRYVRLNVDVDLADPPKPVDLATAGVLTFKHVTQHLWDASTFRWDQCKSGVFELQLPKALQPASLAGDNLDALLEEVLCHESLHQLRSLDLSDNQLAHFPDAIDHFTALRTLSLSANQLTSIPETVGNLTALTWLLVGSNQLMQLPSSIGNLAALSGLRLGHNQLTRIPDSIGNIATLTTLCLNNNQLTSIPDAIGNLTALTHLDLSHNNLTSIPNDAIGDLTALTNLDLFQNLLTSIPDTIKQLKALTRLTLHDNLLWDGIPNLDKLNGLEALCVDSWAWDEENPAYHNGSVVRLQPNYGPKTFAVHCLEDVRAQIRAMFPLPSPVPNGRGTQCCNGEAAMLGGIGCQKQIAPNSKCSGCKTVAYCSRACQREHWKREHKHQCRHISFNQGHIHDPPRASPNEE